MPCNLTVKAGGKHTVTHHCKQYALALAGLVGVDYANMQWIASHERDVTRFGSACAVQGNPDAVANPH